LIIAVFLTQAAFEDIDHPNPYMFAGRHAGQLAANRTQAEDRVFAAGDRLGYGMC